MTIKEIGPFNRNASDCDRQYLIPVPIPGLLQEQWMVWIPRFGTTYDQRICIKGELRQPDQGVRSECVLLFWKWGDY